ncbi:hypothetical protein Patl1_15331 [Pistacia atlantica]|uniref:Uncharacterized protein n=1 Tax=Pistacia atlantica TaxID=434234 RepID=A0ACC1B5I6_9ROSI|nr:hypothetical protein Patl1_15331 [Pistacia atlantica]
MDHLCQITTLHTTTEIFAGPSSSLIVPVSYLRTVRGSLTESPLAGYSTRSSKKALEERKGGRLVAGRLLFRLLSALVASTGMTTFGEILSLSHGTSSRETPDIKDGITFLTLLTRDFIASTIAKDGFGYSFTHFYSFSKLCKYLVFYFLRQVNHSVNPNLCQEPFVYCTQVAVLMTYFLCLAIAGSILPGKVVKGVVLQDGTRLHYRCNGLLLLVLLVALHGIGAQMDFVSPTVISDRGFELLSTTLMLCFLVSDVVSSLGPGKFASFFKFKFMKVTWVLFVTGCRSHNQGSSLKPHVTGNLLHDWYWINNILHVVWNTAESSVLWALISSIFFFVRAGMMGLLLINLSLYILDYFVHEEYVTSTWDIIAERLGFMFVFGDLVWIPFTFSIQACCY